jgi:hypothetical protein
MLDNPVAFLSSVLLGQQVDLVKVNGGWTSALASTSISR